MKKHWFVMVFLGLVLTSGAAMAQMEEESASSGAGTEGATAPPTWVTCTTCANCTSKLLSYTHVKLIANIYDTTTSGAACIKIEKDNRTFNCDYNHIDASLARLGRSGILVTNSASNPIVENVWVQNCILSNWGTDGTYVKPGNYFTDAAIRLYKAEDCHIIDNDISGGNNGYNGIMSRYSNDNEVTGNDIYYTKNIGIGMNDDSTINDITDNYVYGSKVGIMPCHGGGGDTLRLNEVQKSTWYGFCLCDGTAYNELSENTAKLNKTYDIVQYDEYLGEPAGEGNFGDYNICKTVHNWKDIHAVVGCYYTPL